MRVTLDDDMHDADRELVIDFAQALNDRDTVLMDEVVYLAQQRLEKRCRCYNNPCICEER